jgi:phosphatidylserine decarboxylase
MTADDEFRGTLGFARQGLREVVVTTAIAGGAAAASAFVHPIAALPWIVPPLFSAWFFRDPTRHPPNDATAILAPADGRLDDIREEPSCPFLDGPVVRLGIYLSLFDVHVNRAPFAATGERFEYRPGHRQPTWRVDRTDRNEQFVTWLRHARPPHPVAVVRQIAGPAARRICNWLRHGEHVAAGSRIGLIKFGSRTELFVPQSCGFRVVARRGDRVRAGETVLARFDDFANTRAETASCAPRNGGSA